MEMAHDVAH